MITKFKIYEAKDRGKEIVYTFKTKAKTYSKTEVYEYNVNILLSEDEYSNKYGAFILSIEGTPGSWYLSTLIEGDSFSHDKAIIDGGQNWTIDNWSEVSKEFHEIYPRLEMMIQTNKYNI